MKTKDFKKEYDTQVRYIERLEIAIATSPYKYGIKDLRLKLKAAILYLKSTDERYNQEMKKDEPERYKQMRQWQKELKIER